jgi:hypothetical protein
MNFGTKQLFHTSKHGDYRLRWSIEDRSLICTDVTASLKQSLEDIAWSEVKQECVNGISNIDISIS